MVNAYIKITKANRIVNNFHLFVTTVVNIMLNNLDCNEKSCSMNILKNMVVQDVINIIFNIGD